MRFFATLVLNLLIPALGQGIISYEAKGIIVVAGRPADPSFQKTFSSPKGAIFPVTTFRVLSFEGIGHDLIIAAPRDAFVNREVQIETIARRVHGPEQFLNVIKALFRHSLREYDIGNFLIKFQRGETLREAVTQMTKEPLTQLFQLTFNISKIRPSSRPPNYIDIDASNVLLTSKSGEVEYLEVPTEPNPEDCKSLF